MTIRQLAIIYFIQLYVLVLNLNLNPENTFWQNVLACALISFAMPIYLYHEHPRVKKD